MLLLDEIVAFDEANLKLVAAATIRPGWDGNWTALELMAQTAAALAGLHDRRLGCKGPPRPGFLLGTRRLELDLPAFEVGRRYEISARNVLQDNESASFECTVAEGDRTLARAVLTAYRPVDVEQFLSAQSRSARA